ncbi:hypothetical protein WJX73_002966 [Symbiochloris irregularis]|uniref:Coiled-coil domain-containing protein 12 n=1 Tax=Symbiochloris irregularis TaxID=706552 RepID=A0AAW1P132_9CHLO
MEDAAARRARLKALRAAAEAEGPGDQPVSASAEDLEAAAQPTTATEEPQLKFRNYTVKNNKRVAHDTIQPAQPPELVEPVIEPVDQTEDPLASVAPRQANWDLRRDVAKKLEKLDRRTQRAMLTLMQQQERDRLEDAGGIRD